MNKAKRNRVLLYTFLGVFLTPLIVFFFYFLLASNYEAAGRFAAPMILFGIFFLVEVIKDKRKKRQKTRT